MTLVSILMILSSVSVRHSGGDELINIKQNSLALLESGLARVWPCSSLALIESGIDQVWH